jgi:hypothetical protein
VGFFAIGIEHPRDIPNAFMTAMRAIIVGPPRDTRNRTSIAAWHSGSAESFLGKAVCNRRHREA